MKQIDYIISDLQILQTDLKKDLSAFFQDLYNSINENNLNEAKKDIEELKKFLEKEGIL